MKTNNENFDEVVFETRNKNYGAYFLRKNYKFNLSRALFLALLFFLGMVSIPLIAGLMNEENTNPVIASYETSFISAPPDADKKIELPPAPKIKDLIKPFSPPVVVDSTQEEDTVSIFDIVGGVTNGTPGSDNTGGSVALTSDKVLIELPEDNSVYIIVTDMPEFSGGEDKMYDYLKHTIDYPEIAVKTGIQGNVLVKFIVEKDGSISNVTVLKDIGGGCGDEALRAVKAMPKWKVGKQNGNAVRVQFILPVHFMLED